VVDGHARAVFNSSDKICYRLIGAGHVIDYTQEDFIKNGLKFDLILDTFIKSPFIGNIRSLNENGTYLNDNPGLWGGFRSSGATKKSSCSLIIRITTLEDISQLT
jgi:hypothetical protein